METCTTSNRACVVSLMVALQGRGRSFICSPVPHLQKCDLCSTILLNLLNFLIFSPPRKLSIDVNVCTGAKKWTYDSVRFFQWAGSWKGRRALSRLLLSLSQCHWQPSRNVRPRPTLFVTGSHHSKTHVNLLRKNIRTAAFQVCKCCGVVLIDRNWLWSLFNVRSFPSKLFHRAFYSMPIMFWICNFKKPALVNQ